MPESTTPPIKFPPKRETDKPLVLPKRRLRSPFEVSETAAETQKTITALRTVTRNPWGDPVDIGAEKIAELEKSLKQLSSKLEERERTLQEFEVRLLERERDMAETENLLRARESLLEASKAKSSGDSRPMSQAEEAALTKLKAEIERQQESLQEQRQAMREREAFLDESETKLFQKVQQHQEKETELEQTSEDLARRERRLREREAQFDPTVAAALQAEKAAAKKFNEFTE